MTDQRRIEYKFLHWGPKFMITLIEDESLRKRLGREARETIEKGKFSIDLRNKKLKEIFEDSLRK